MDLQLDASDTSRRGAIHRAHPIHDDGKESKSNNAADSISSSIKKKALDLLARREHSRLELRRKLRSRFDAPDLIETVLNELSDADWLSESRFVESYIRFRAGRGFGPAHIRQALLQRGISRNLIDRFLFSLPDIDWQERADYVRIKKYGNAPPANYVDQMKQSQFLRYRGFDDFSELS